MNPMKRQGKITVTYRPPARSFDLLGGWVEVWESRRAGTAYLGLIVGLERLERYVSRRPGRVFVVRFVQRETDGNLMPIGSFAAEAAPADWPAPIRFFPVSQVQQAEGERRKAE